MLALSPKRRADVLRPLHSEEFSFSGLRPKTLLPREGEKRMGLYERLLQEAAEEAAQEEEEAKLERAKRQRMSAYSTDQNS